MNYLNKKEYLDYINTLDVVALSEELNFLIRYKNKLFDIYNDLINKVEKEIYNKTEIKLYDTLCNLNDYLNNTVKDILEFKNIKRSFAAIEDLSCEKLKEEIFFKYVEIFEVELEKYSEFGILPQFDVIKLNNSYYDSLRLLYNSLLKVINNYIELLDEDFIYNIDHIRDDIVFVTEKYSNRYINLNHKLELLIPNDQYKILEKYDCLKEIIKIILVPNLMSVDEVDLKNFFKDSKIVRIIYNDVDHVISDAKATSMIFIKNVTNITLKEYEELKEQYRLLYDNYIDDCLMGLYFNYDEESTVVIYLSSN